MHIALSCQKTAINIGDEFWDLHPSYAVNFIHKTASGKPKNQPTPYKLTDINNN